jgi:hypothetical protein
MPNVGQTGKPEEKWNNGASALSQGRATRHQKMYSNELFQVQAGNVRKRHPTTSKKQPLGAYVGQLWQRRSWDGWFV